MAVGLYLPLSTTMPIFVGGVVRHFVEKRSHEPKEASERGILSGSGMVGGEGLIGVAIALMLINDKSRQFMTETLNIGGSWWTPLGAWGDTLSLLVFIALIVLLWRTSMGRGAKA